VLIPLRAKIVVAEELLGFGILVSYLFEYSQNRVQVISVMVNGIGIAIIPFF